MERNFQETQWKEFQEEVEQIWKLTGPREGECLQRLLRDSSLMDTQLWVGTSVWWKREVSMRQAKQPLNHDGNGGLLSEACASQRLLWGAPHAACTFVHEDGHHDLSFKPSFPCVYLWHAHVTVHMWRSEANMGCWSSPSTLLEASLLALYCVHQACSSGSIQGFSCLHLSSC